MLLLKILGYYRLFHLKLFFFYYKLFHLRSFLAILNKSNIWLLVVILLVLLVVINGYWYLFYLWLLKILVVILLIIIGGYSINGH
jgi:hypothetical protein